MKRVCCVADKKVELPNDKQALYRAARAQRRQIMYMKRQNSISDHGPKEKTDENILTISSNRKDSTESNTYTF